jgi:hypothetical protein
MYPNNIIEDTPKMYCLSEIDDLLQRSRETHLDDIDVVPPRKFDLEYHSP